MSRTNTSDHYGAVTKSFHWLTALLILTLIPLGIYANGLPYETSEALATKAWMFSLHKTLGVTMFFVALARIAWAISQPKPPLLHPDRKLETLAAETVHWLLYGSLLVVPLTGWVHHASTSGFAPIWWPFGQNLPLVPKSEHLAGWSAGLHIVFERVLALALILHFAGALKHHFIDRDATLLRMLPGKPDVSKEGHVNESDPRKWVSLGSAAAIWAAALCVGAVLGVYGEHDHGEHAAALETVQSDWNVQTGALDITVTQLGSPVTGNFADWTAAIRFDETVTSGSAGSVDVVISIGSLTLGSVTSQALNADYFNVEGFPTARFQAEIATNENGYTATGTLSIKEHSMPITMPFSLDTSNGIATMQGSTTLDRRDFKIGAAQQDEGTLGFEVTVNIQLTAKNAQ
ncbi:MAG: cytochrome b/b6 domain-containing protein [Roseobacter sp.]